ncbi:MAG: sensor histidine kinase [Sphingorhabdus sp.]
MSKLLERIEIAQEAAGIGIHDYDIIADSIEWDARTRAIWGVDANAPISYATFAKGVHPDDLPKVEAAISAAHNPSGDGRYLIRYRVISSDGIERHVEAIGRTAFVDTQPVRMVGTVRDISAEIAAERELEEAQRFAQNLIDTVPTILYIFDLVEKRNIFMGPQIVPMTNMDADGYRQLDDNVIETVIHPEDLGRVQAHHHAIRERLVEPPFEIEYRTRTADGDWIWLSSTEVVHLRDPDGRPRQILGASLDITRRHEERALRQLLTKELEHRVGNVYSVMQSVATLTLRNHCPPDIWHEFEKRLSALSKGQRLLTEKHWQIADLGDIAEQIFQPFRNDETKNIQASGPPTAVTGAQVATIALMLHELATNALKYGALSIPGGQVELSWRSEDKGAVIEWRETGGPAVDQPSGAGFGSALITSLMKDSAQDGIEYRPEGLYCRLTL